VLSPNGNVSNPGGDGYCAGAGLREISEYNAILSAIGLGATQRNEIAMQTGLAQTFAFRTRLEKLVELGLIEATRNFGAFCLGALPVSCVDPAPSFLLQYRRKISQRAGTR